jgi:homoserine O-acetyltransferase
MNLSARFWIGLATIGLAGVLGAADYPAPTEDDYVIRDFKFASGETLPELRIHYRVIGKPMRDEKVSCAMRSSSPTAQGSGAQFIRPESAGELFGASQPLDATKFSRLA